MRYPKHRQPIAAAFSLMIFVTACGKQPEPVISPAATATSSIPTKTMHPSWDADQNGINDCEDDGSCDHTTDYTQPRPAAKTQPQSPAALGPFRFICNDAAQSVFIATFHQSPTSNTPSDRLQLEHQGATRELTAVIAASGSKYEGDEASFWEHQGEARIRWQTDAPELQCKPLP